MNPVKTTGFTGFFKTKVFHILLPLIVKGAFKTCQECIGFGAALRRHQPAHILDFTPISRERRRFLRGFIPQIHFSYIRIGGATEPRIRSRLMSWAARKDPNIRLSILSPSMKYRPTE